MNSGDNFRIPEPTEGVRCHLDPLVELINELARPGAPVHAALIEQVLSIETPEHVLVIDEDNNLKETDQHYAKPCFARFYFNATSGEIMSTAYMGTVRRPLDKENFLGYTPEVMKQLRHQTALRLQKLSESKREIYFSSELLNYENKKVTQELINELLTSDSKKLDIVRDALP